MALAALGAGAYFYFATDDSAAGGQARPSGGRPGGGPPGGFSRAATVVAEPVALRSIIESIEAVGTARANESVTLTAKVTETVRRVGFDDGELVQAGAVLVELTNEEETAQLAEAQANLDDARSQHKRFEDLVAQRNAPVSQLDEARARLRGMEARYEGILARLADRLIRAPFDGVLGFRDISPGTLVTPGTRITTIDDISIIKLDFSVPETYYAALRSGMKIFAQSAAWSDRRFEGVVRTVGSRVDPVTRSVEVRAHVPNDDRSLRPGMLLTVNIVRSEREALTVDESSLVQVGLQAYVYVVEGDRVRRTPIGIGSRQFGFAEVTGGVPAGAIVVTDGVVKLRDGAQVRLVDASGKDTGAPAPKKPAAPGGKGSASALGQRES